MAFLESLLGRLVKVGEGGHRCLTHRDPLRYGLSTCKQSVMSIDFDVEKLIGRLDIIEKTQIPFAANLALRRLGSLLKNQLLPAEMQKSFTAPDGYGKPVPEH